MLIELLTGDKLSDEVSNADVSRGLEEELVQVRSLEVQNNHWLRKK